MVLNKADVELIVSVLLILVHVTVVAAYIQISLVGIRKAAVFFLE